MRTTLEDKEDHSFTFRGRTISFIKMKPRHVGIINPVQRTTSDHLNTTVVDLLI